ncbi:MAG: hypothetical protein RMZ41_013185 [Nostoc sp. DedVER02]|nr:hypothetical protein [Nostoc sp. DedVER01b]
MSYAKEINCNLYLRASGFIRGVLTTNYYFLYKTLRDRKGEYPINNYLSTQDD